ncbi:MAG TPA: DUF1330 domain-containing protein [Phycisphaerales bacterium]|nr:DUF1330 domain-containing protein [Phycisphaerales bacterium]
MPYESIVAMHVTDPAGYAAYRAGMTPILRRYGGGFRYDVIVSDTLESAAPHPINRLFAIFFRDPAARDAFFADPEYLRVRAEHFVQSVGGFTVIAEHERE